MAVDFETGNLTQATHTFVQGTGSVLEAVAGSAYAGNYGLHAAYAGGAFGDYACAALAATQPVGGHRWIWGWIRLNSRSGGFYHAILHLDDVTPTSFVCAVTYGPSNCILEFRDADTNLHQQTFAFPSAGWHFYRLHVDTSGTQDQATLYIDANQVAQVTLDGHHCYTCEHANFGPMGTYIEGTASIDLSYDDIDVGIADPGFGSGTPELVIAGASHAHTAGNVTLTSPSGPLTDIFFQHHSTGANLIAEGDVVDGLTALGYDFYDQGYNYEGYYNLNGVDIGDPYTMPDDNTDYNNWDTIWTAPNAWLTGALTHQVIGLKACFPNSDVLDAAMLSTDETNIATLRTIADANTGKLFFVFTQPPLLPAGGGTAGTNAYTSAANATRARTLANWMVNSLADGRENIRVFDFFDLLANANDASVEPNCLKTAYRKGGDDAHPNSTANAAIGPQFVSWLDAQIKSFSQEIVIPVFMFHYAQMR